jgi:hypothetical protein
MLPGVGGEEGRQRVDRIRSGRQMTRIH